MSARLAFRLQLGAFMMALLAITASAASAFEAPDWERQTRGPGTIRFECRAPSCKDTSVSYSKEAGNIYMDRAGFRRVKKGTETVRGVVYDFVRVVALENKIGRYTHFQTTDRMVFRSSGKVQYILVGLLIGQSASYGLTSSSPDRAAAERNYREVLGIARGLLDRAGP
jgi:hypothetical protein